MRPRTALKSALIFAAAIAVVAVAALLWLKLAPRQVPPGQPPLATLNASSVPAFRDAFNAGDGEVRILALLSPT